MRGQVFVISGFEAVLRSRAKRIFSADVVSQMLVAEERAPIIEPPCSQGKYCSPISNVSSTHEAHTRGGLVGPEHPVASVSRVGCPPSAVFALDLSHHCIFSHSEPVVSGQGFLAQLLTLLLFSFISCGPMLCGPPDTLLPLCSHIFTITRKSV